LKWRTRRRGVGLNQYSHSTTLLSCCTLFSAVLLFLCWQRTGSFIT
jgi:hypothetical protein